MKEKPEGCIWRRMPDPSLPKDSCKHPWAPAGVGARCSYKGREEECPTKQYGLQKEDDEDRD